MATKKKSRSGTTRTYAERKAAGRGLVSLTMSDETKALLDELAQALGISRAATVELALREFDKKRR
jgi:hypothetical protein